MKEIRKKNCKSNNRKAIQISNKELVEAEIKAKPTFICCNLECEYSELPNLSKDVTKIHFCRWATEELGGWRSLIRGNHNH